MSSARHLTLLTFGPMIDSELSRFLLWRYQTPYSEARHIFGWASILALLHGGTGQVPLIFGNGLRLTGPRAIIDHYDPLCAPDLILIPPRQPLRTRVEADWTSFNGELAVYTARIAYFHLLPHREIMLEPFTRGLPTFEKSVTPSLYPALRRLFTLLLRLDPTVVADGLDQAKRIVDSVDHRLADGRKFLWGDALTLSDLSFATALAPLLLPDGYNAPVPAYGLLPEALKALVDSFRRRPASALVTRIYAFRNNP